MTSSMPTRRRPRAPSPGCRRRAGSAAGRARAAAARPRARRLGRRRRRTARAPRRPSRDDRREALGLGLDAGALEPAAAARRRSRRRGAARQPRAAARPRRRSSSAGRPATTACPRRCPHAEAAWLAKSLTRRELAAALARGRRDRARDRVLGAVLSAPTSAQRLVLVDAVGDDDALQRHPPLRQRAGLVEHDRVDAARRLEDLRALDEQPELGAAAGADEQRRRRREAERARAGDDQHGDGRGERDAGLARADPEAERRGGDHEDDRHEDRRDAVGEPLDGRLAGLRARHERADLRERRVGADARRAHDDAPADVDGRARDGVAGRTSTGTLSPVSSERSTAESPRRPRRRSRSSRRGARRSGRRTQLARRARAARRRRRRGRRRPSRRARCSARSAAPARRLARASNVAPGEQERDDDADELEVDLARVARRARGRSSARGAGRARPRRGRTARRPTTTMRRSSRSR